MNVSYVQKYEHRKLHLESIWSKSMDEVASVITGQKVEGELGDLGHTEQFDFYEEQLEVVKPLVNRVLSITWLTTVYVVVVAVCNKCDLV